MNYRLFLVFILLSLCSSLSLIAQEPAFYFEFEPATSELIRPTINKEEAVYIVDLQEPEFVKGVKGLALDLSEDAILRSPLKLDSNRTPGFDESFSFTFQAWVKTKPEAIMGSPIAGNLSSDYSGKPGWQLRTQANGAWALYLSDGKTMFEYLPMANRQRINDGEWHQIVFSLDRNKEEAWMYFDGINVAIYNTAGLRSMEGGLSTVIGGADEKWEYGSGGQWYAFNGYIDEVKIWDKVIPAPEILELYNSVMPPVSLETQNAPSQLKVLAWNIWHGGHRYGSAVGLRRVIEIIKDTDPDIVGLIETYGSGEEIADSLGYYFYLISSNLSIMSRYPILETVKAFKPFNFGGAKLHLGSKQDLVFFNTWLHYLPSVYKSIQEGKPVEFIISEEGKTRHGEIQNILKEIKPILGNSDNVPTVMSGDFNCGSHLDWIEETKDIHFGYVIEWPVSREMIDAGFIDSYREMHINPLLDPGLTWTPRAATSSDKYGLRNRIDYIYYQGIQLKAIESKVIDYHPIMFPSDHAGIITVFKLSNK